MDLALMYQLGTIIIMLLIIFFCGKPESRHLRLLMCTLLIPLCYEVLHMTCFFHSVPHCLGCLLVSEGEIKPEYDANDLKMACFGAYSIVLLIATPFIVKKNVAKGKKIIISLLIIAGYVFIGFPLAMIQYM